MTQGTDAWFELRAGKPCTSGFQNIITPLGARTTGERRRKYMMRLLAERLWGRSMEDKFENYWTIRGKEMEPRAIEAYTEHTGHQVCNGVFITNFEGMVGCSPDRLVVNNPTVAPDPDDSLECVEVKCTSPWQHVDYIVNGPGYNYRQQVQGQLWVGEFERNDFWAWHPQAPPVYLPVLRDDEFIEKLEAAVFEFLDELAEAEVVAREAGEFHPGPEEAIQMPGVFPWREGDVLQ